MKLRAPSPALVPWIACAAMAVCWAAGAPREVGEWMAGAAVLAAAAGLVRVARSAPATRPVTVPLAVGTTAYGLGWLVWGALRLVDPSPPDVPTIADGLWLAFYPCAIAAIVWPMQRSAVRVPRTMWLDIATVTLAVAAVGAEVVVAPLMTGAPGSAFAIATSAAYPSLDLVLAATLTAACVVVGWSAPARIAGAGLLLLAIGDFSYLTGVADAAPGIAWATSLTSATAIVIITAAAQRPLRPLRPRGDVPGVLTPAAFAVVALGMLVLDNASGIHAETVALATAAVGTALARLVATVRVERALRTSRRLALTDELTRLPNRRALARTVERRVAGGDGVALVVLDLDGFKEVNDSLGHVAGDELLTLAGRRLAEALPAGDMLARLGGDEFAAVVDADVAEQRAHALLAVLASPFEVGRVAVQVGASAGVARCPEHGTTAFELLRRGDEAMYRAKADRGTVAVAADAEDGQARLRIELLGELSAAIDAGEVAPHFQVQVRPADGRVVGVEALARWDHPRHGILAPELFLPGRAQGGLGRALTRAMVRAATEQAAAWRVAGLDVPVAVNLCAADLADDALPAEVVDACVAQGLPTSALRLEVTETVVMADPDAGIARLEQLRRAGIGLALDDFGTHHSSLAYLDAMPVDELKIDRAFVNRLDRGRTARIVASTVSLARVLGLRTVAEGVEDAAQGEALAAMGVDALQGFHFSRPLPAGELLRRAEQGLVAA